MEERLLLPFQLQVMKADVFLCFLISILSKNLCFTINSDVVFVLFWTVLKQRKQSEVVVFKLHTRMLLVGPA